MPIPENYHVQRSEGMRDAADPSQRLLLVDRAVAIPLGSEDQTRFAGVNWINKSKGLEDAPETPQIGVRSIIVGNPNGFAIITRDMNGAFVKRTILETQAPAIYLSDGDTRNERNTVYTNDSRMKIGDAYTGSLRDIKVVFAKDVDLDAKKVELATDLALELLKTIQQDRTARVVKQEQINLREKFARVVDPKTLESMIDSLDRVLVESGIEKELISDATTSLPVKMRELAERKEQEGIKFIEDNFFDRRYGLWPDAIRETWSEDTDGLPWDLWAEKGHETDYIIAERQRRFREKSA